MERVKRRRRCIFVDDSMWREIAEAAKRQDRSTASWIREALREELEATVK